jgi:hypothetical protein
LCDCLNAVVYQCWPLLIADLPFGDADCFRRQPKSTAWLAGPSSESVEMAEKSQSGDFTKGLK